MERHATFYWRFIPYSIRGHLNTCAVFIPWAGPALYMGTVMQGKHQGWRRLLRGHSSPGVKRRGSLLESARLLPSYRQGWSRRADWHTLFPLSVWVRCSTSIDHFRTLSTVYCSDLCMVLKSFFSISDRFLCHYTVWSVL